MGHILQSEDITNRLAPLKGQSVIVTTNGCFDLLHVGHLRYLKEAKKLGDTLVVLLNTDASVKRLKGETRPILPEAERAELMAGLECVDYVVLFDEDTPVNLLKQIKPDIHVKGGDYDVETLPETPALRELGAKITFLPFIEGRSTSTLIRQIQALPTQ